MESSNNAPKKKSDVRRAPRHIGEAATAGYNRVVDILTRDLFNLPKNQKKTRQTWFAFLGGKHNISSLLSKNIFEKNESTHSQNPSHRSPELKKVIRRANDVLATATTVFPFDFFPDTISVDRTKVTIKKKSFFWSEQVMSIRIEDVLNVTTSIGPFFGSLTIASRIMSTEDHFTTRFFWRNDAMHLKHIIQGYVIARHNGLDIKHLSTRNLMKTLKELGHETTS